MTNQFSNVEVVFIKDAVHTATKSFNEKHQSNDHSVNLIGLFGLSTENDVIKFLESPAGEVIQGMMKEAVLEERAQITAGLRLQQEASLEKKRQLGMLLLAVQEEKEHQHKIRTADEANQQSLERQKQHYQAEVDACDSMIHSLNVQIDAIDQELEQLQRKIDENQQHFERLKQKADYFEQAFGAPENNFNGIYHNIEQADSNRLSELHNRLEHINGEITQLQQVTAAAVSNNTPGYKQQLLKLEALEHTKAHISEQHELFYGLKALTDGYELQHRNNAPPCIRLSNFDNQLREIHETRLAFDDNGNVCRNHKDAAYLPYFNKHLFIGPDNQWHYAKKLEFYQNFSDFNQAMENKQVYFFDKSGHVTMDREQAIYFNFIPKDHEIRQEQGTYNVYDGDGQFKSSLTDYAQTHSAARFVRNSDKLRPHRTAVRSELEQSLTNAQEKNKAFIERKRLCLQRRECLSSCKERLIQRKVNAQSKLTQLTEQTSIKNSNILDFSPMNATSAKLKDPMIDAELLLIQELTQQLIAEPSAASRLSEELNCLNHISDRAQTQRAQLNDKIEQFNSKSTIEIEKEIMRLSNELLEELNESGYESGRDNFKPGR